MKGTSSKMAEALNNMLSNLHGLSAGINCQRQAWLIVGCERQVRMHGLNGKESNSDEQITRSCTHFSSSCICLELHVLLEFSSICQGIVSSSNSSHLIHISTVNQELLFILEYR